MARRVFFSFHHKNDNWRANHVRNSWVTQNRESAGFWDATEWEEVKKKEDDAIRNWIRNQMKGSSVTVVLIGSETSTRKWVRFEIKESYTEGMGILGIYIHKLKDKDGNQDTQGDNPFDYVYIEQSDGSKKYFSSIYSTYAWNRDDGYNNMGDWIEKAAKKAGR